MLTLEIIDTLNRLTTKFSSIEAKIEKEDQALLLLTSLPPLYDTLVTILLIGKDVLKLEDVTIIFDAILNRHALRPSKQYWITCPRKLKSEF